jgi:D-3-phosphoglycerate dehydrogenase
MEAAGLFPLHNRQSAFRNPMPLVLLTDYAWTDTAIERSVLAEAGAELRVAERYDAAALAEAARDADAIMTCWAKVPESVLAAAPRCRIVARMGIGLDNIDVAAATRRGIVVTNVPDYCLAEVAEHTIALLLALARNVAWHHLATKQGCYDLRSGPSLRRVAGRTLGIVGCGNIGRRVATLARGLGLAVLATGRNPSRLPPTVAWRTLEDLLAESDFVSLHLPLARETAGIVGAEALARMKPTAFLINTARAGLVDHEALGAALAEGRLAGAALDVQAPEPPDLSKPPLDDPRVIVTPHAAFASVESVEELRRRAARQVADCLAGRRPENIVNPEALDPRIG